MSKRSDDTQALAARLMAQRVQFPEVTHGGISIRHRHCAAGERLLLVSDRIAYFTGEKPCEYVCAEPTTIHSLESSEHGVWMTDLPCELVQMRRELASQLSGSVLVGGLGLGIVATMAARVPRVTQVTVVERDADVIGAVWPWVVDAMGGKRVTLVRDNLYDYVVAKGEHHFALLDTWQGTGEMVWAREVVPLRRRFAPLVKTIRCWQEGVMLGQVARGVLRSAPLDPALFCSPIQRANYAFARACQASGVVDRMELPEDQSERFERFVALEQAMHKNIELARVKYMLRLFCYEVGSRLWEATYGKYWDEVPQ